MLVSWPLKHLTTRRNIAALACMVMMKMMVAFVAKLELWFDGWDDDPDLVTCFLPLFLVASATFSVGRGGRAIG